MPIINIDKINIDEDLLLALQIIKSDGKRDNLEKFLQHYIAANPQFTDEDTLEAALNTELGTTVALITEAKNSAAAFLKNNGLQPMLNESGEPNFRMEWDPKNMSVNVKLKIAGQHVASDEHALHFEGREIEIKISNTASSNDFTSDDLIAQFQSRAKAAKKLLSRNDDKYIEALLKLYIIKLQDAIKTKARKDTPHIIDLQASFKLLNKDEILSIQKEVINEFIINLAIEVIRSNKNDKNYTPTAAEIERLTRIMRQTEIDILSTTPRPILMDFYPQVIRDSEVIQYLHTINIPHSDVSSEDRMLDIIIPVNLWHTFIYTYKIKPELDRETSQLNYSVLSRDLYMQLFRSGSPAQLNKTDTSNAEELELQSLSNFLIQRARENLINKINSGEFSEYDMLARQISVPTAYISLLSPFIEKGRLTKTVSEVSKLTKSKSLSKLSDTVHDKNEHEQLESLKHALQQLDEQQLSFSPKDIEQIMSRTADSEFFQAASKKKIDEFRSFLSKPIVHEEFALNFVSNLGTHNLDLNNNNYEYNIQGLLKLNAYLARLFKNNNIKVPPELFDDLKEGKTLVGEWKSLQAALQEIYDKEKYDTQVKRAIELYIEIRNFIEKHAKWFAAPEDNSLTIDSVQAAQKAAILANLLGFTVHAFCKSGKDRTGLFMAGIEATATPDELYAINLYRAMHLSESITGIPVWNGGGRVLQIDAKLFKGLKAYFNQKLEERDVKQLYDLVNSWAARQVGKIGRFYPSKANVEDYLTNTTLTAAPVATSSPKPPPIPRRPASLTKNEASQKQPSSGSENRQSQDLLLQQKHNLRHVDPTTKQDEQTIEPPTRVSDLIKHWEKTHNKPPK